MGKFFFSGSSYAKLDGKNRFVLPQSLRLGLVEDGVLECTLALGLGGCLAIYRRSDIDRIVKKFQSKQHLAKYQKFFTLFFSTLHPVTCDSVGRVLLPSTLKQAVGIDEEIVIAGVLDRIEIWSRERYDQQVGAILKGDHSDIREMMEEAFGLLTETEGGGARMLSTETEDNE